MAENDSFDSAASHAQTPIRRYRPTSEAAFAVEMSRLLPKQTDGSEFPAFFSDPEAVGLLQEILYEIKNLNFQIAVVTGVGTEAI